MRSRVEVPWRLTHADDVPSILQISLVLLVVRLDATVEYYSPVKANNRKLQTPPLHLITKGEDLEKDEKDPKNARKNRIVAREQKREKKRGRD